MGITKIKINDELLEACSLIITREQRRRLRKIMGDNDFRNLPLALELVLNEYDNKQKEKYDGKFRCGLCDSVKDVARGKMVKFDKYRDVMICKIHKVAK